MSCAGRRRALGLGQQRRVRLLDHLLAEVDVRHAVVEDRVVEDVVGRLGEVERQVAERRRLDAVGHVLVQARAGAVVVTADAADPARDEVGVARIDPLHEDVEPAEDHRGAVALEHLLVGEVDLGVDAEAADDPRDRIPGHLLDHHLLLRGCLSRHLSRLLTRLSRKRSQRAACSALTTSSRSRWSASVPRRRHSGSMSYLFSMWRWRM